MPTAPLIMIIRHGEKPTQDLAGVDLQGKSSDHDLIVRGWQRAGALVQRFAPFDGAAVDSRLARPAHVMAMSPEGKAAYAKEKSHREVQTATPIAAALAVELDQQFGKGKEPEAARAAMALDGPVLIVWDHDRILDLAREITDAKLPAEWPGERFDLIFVFRPLAGGGYSFEQVPEMLLAGDEPTCLPV